MPGLVPVDSAVRAEARAGSRPVQGEGRWEETRP